MKTRMNTRAIGRELRSSQQQIDCFGPGIGHRMRAKLKERADIAEAPATGVKSGVISPGGPTSLVVAKPVKATTSDQAPPKAATMIRCAGFPSAQASSEQQSATGPGEPIAIIR